MSDRVSASITIGGTMTATTYADLAALIVNEALSTEWDGAVFALDRRIDGEPLTLYAHDVPWGRFEQLEAFCVANRLPFTRWSGGYAGLWDAERIVFTGDGEPQAFGASEDDDVRIGRHTAQALGSFTAIIANFDAADFMVPPLISASSSSSTT